MRPWPMPMRRVRPACRCAIFRGYRGADLAKVNPNIKSVTCPFTGEVLAAVPSVRPDVTFIHAQKANRQGRRAGRGHHRHPEGSGACRQARRGHGRGGGRRFRRPAPQPDASCRTGRSRRSPWSRAARIPPTRTATTSATTRPISNGTRSRPTATASATGCRRTCWKRPPTISPAARRASEERSMSELGFTPNEMMTIAAARALEQRRRLLRRHRRALGRLQRRAADPCARHHADLRMRHHRHRARRAAAVDRRRRTVRHGASPPSRCRRCSATGCRAAASRSASWARPSSTSSATSTPP